MSEDYEKFPELKGFYVGDPDLAKEIARRWNSFPDLLTACMAVLDRTCGCNSHDPEWHSSRCLVPLVRSAVKQVERTQP